MHFHHHHHGAMRHCREAMRHGMEDGFGHGRGGRHGRGEGGLFGGGGFGGGRGGGRRRLFSGDELKLVLLTLIAAEPRHGYDLIREIEGLSGGGYVPSPGVVYPTLTLMADMGLIAEQPGEGSRKLFAITDSGAAYLTEQVEQKDEAMARLAMLAKRAERTDGASIRRALHNLSIAIQQRLEKEGADAETKFDIASLIDEAASKIERLK
ncbi:PadR family transcriptional regulator [Sphingobium aromaticiconvertens]|uniref:PadR family transcriptional regulator n=1 Tax=Sphingobium aromaticiconvertens TaxID=365341 RepID=UPI00301A1D2A